MVKPDVDMIPMTLRDVGKNIVRGQFYLVNAFPGVSSEPVRAKALEVQKRSTGEVTNVIFDMSDAIDPGVFAHALHYHGRSIASFAADRNAIVYVPKKEFFY